MEKTRVIYYLNNEKMPYVVTLSVKPDNASIRDLKKILEKDHKLKVFFIQWTKNLGNCSIYRFISHSYCYLAPLNIKLILDWQKRK